MIQVKIFENNSINTLQSEINNWIKNSKKIDIKDIKFCSLYHESTIMGAIKSYQAIIIYKGV